MKPFQIIFSTVCLLVLSCEAIAQLPSQQKSEPQVVEGVVVDQAGGARVKGKSSLRPDLVLAKIIRPAAVRAGIKKRIGWHTFRHSLMSVLFNHAIRYEWLEQGKNPITLVVKALPAKRLRQMALLTS